MSFKSVLEASYDSFDISREDPSPVVSSLSLDIETSCNLDSEFDKEVGDCKIEVFCMVLHILISLNRFNTKQMFLKFDLHSNSELLKIEVYIHSRKQPV